MSGTYNNSSSSDDEEFALNAISAGRCEMLAPGALPTWRILEAILQRAERAIGASGEGTLRDRAQLILREATRSRAVSPGQYKLCWFVEQHTRPEVTARSL